MRKRALFSALLGAALVLSGVKGARAVSLASLQAGTSGATLNSVLGPGVVNGQIRVGHLLFSGFGVTSSVGNATFNPANVDVSPTQVGGIDGISINAFVASASAPAVQINDLGFNYTVTAVGGVAISDFHASAVLGSTFTGGTPGPGDAIFNTVTENMLGPGFTNTIILRDNRVPPLPNDVLLDVSGPVVPNQTSLSVHKDISIILTLTGAGATGALATNSSLLQQYSVTPEPGTMAMLLGLGVSGGLFGFKLRRR